MTDTRRAARRREERRKNDPRNTNLLFFMLGIIFAMMLSKAVVLYKNYEANKPHRHQYEVVAGSYGNEAFSYHYRCVGCGDEITPQFYTEHYAD